MKKFNHFFDRLEDKIRAFLSRYPIFYAFIGGVALISFWRGVWESSDLLGIHPVTSLVGGLAVLMAIGILVTEFLGNRIIISGLRGEKKLEEKNLEEIEHEEAFLHNLKKKIDRIEKMLESLNEK